MSTTVPSRTRTYRLMDAPGAHLTVTCPSWCTDGHAEERQRGIYAADFMHRGDEHSLAVPLDNGGQEDILVAQIHQAPFGTDARRPVVLLWPTMGMTEVQLVDADGIAALAARLREYALELDDLGRGFEAARAEDECGARKPGWENGPPVGRHRIPCVRPAAHPGDHRDGLGQTWTAGGAR